MTGGIATSLAGSSASSLPGVHVPVRKATEETWPSPIVRSDRTMRSAPSGAPLWSGCGTALGLNSAAAAKAYSSLK